MVFRYTVRPDATSLYKRPLRILTQNIMADFTVSTDIDTLLQSASNAAARTNLGLGTAATTAARTTLRQHRAQQLTQHSSHQ